MVISFAGNVIKTVAIIDYPSTMRSLLILAKTPAFLPRMISRAMKSIPAWTPIKGQFLFLLADAPPALRLPR
jgi:hypothetical protein